MMLLVLSACGRGVSKDQIEYAEFLCKDFGGLKYIYNPGGDKTVICDDDTTLKFTDSNIDIMKTNKK